jgi:hypothetical protein
MITVVVPGKRTLSVMVVLGLAATLGSLVWSFKLVSESGWKTTTGKVLSREIGQTSDKYQDNILIYSFVVDGKTYKAAENMGSTSHDRHPVSVGQELGVAYNPSNPAESRLAQGNQFKIACIALVCAIVSLSGTAFAAWLLWLNHSDS